jgi:hypothetical protein
MRTRKPVQPVASVDTAGGGTRRAGHTVPVPPANGWARTAGQ